MSWGAFEEVENETGNRRIFIAVPPALAASNIDGLAFSRMEDPRFLTPSGWSDVSEMIPVVSMFQRKDAAYLEIDEDTADEIDDYQHVEVRLPGREQSGVVVWPPKPLPEEPKSKAPEPKVELPRQEPPKLKPELTTTNVDPNIYVPRGSTGAGETSTGRTRMLLFVALAIGVLAIIAAVAFFLFREGEPELPVENKGSSGQEVDEPEQTEDGPESEEQVEPEQADDDSEPTGQGKPQPKPGPARGDLFAFRQALQNGDFESARGFLDRLRVTANPEAALIAAQHAGARPFSPGLFAEQDDNEAYQLFKLACRGGAGARQPLDNWVAAVKSETPSGQTPPVIVSLGEKLLTTCKD